MKLDIVMTHYHEDKLWPFVCKGLIANKDYINKVIIVNDGPWEYTLPIPNGIEILFLDQVKNGYGVGRAINKGVSFVTTPYFVILQGDFMLANNSLKKNIDCLDEESIIGGPFQDAEPQENGEIIIADHQDIRLVSNPPGPGIWKACRGGYLCLPTQGFRDIGGYDERYIEYGYEDYDLAIRWFHKFGDDTIGLGAGNAYHLYPKNKIEKVAGSSSFDLFVESLHKYRGGYLVR